MIKLTESDFSPPEAFKLHWRWAKDSSLPEDEHTQTLLLVPEKAQELWDHSRVYWHEIGGRLWNYRGGQPRYEPKVSFFAEESIHVISTKDTMFASQTGQVAQIQQELLAKSPRQEIQLLLRRGEWRDLLAAIKLYSQEAGVGLAKAKEATDQMRADMKRQQEE